MQHDLKTDPAAYRAVAEGRKNFEIRKNDRNFQIGDTLRLNETTRTGAEIAAGAPLEYTGRTRTVRVTYILQGPAYGLAEGWCVMSIAGAE